MPTLSRKEIRNRAHAFVKEWHGETREHAEAKSFWEAFFNIFGVTRRRVASFEEPVKKAGGGQGFIDLLWKGKLLIEHKSTGKDLDKAYDQALGYFPGLKDEELPRYVLVSDFAHFALHDLDDRSNYTFALEQLPDQVHLFDFVAGYEDDDRLKQAEIELNIQAGEKLGSLHDALRDSGYQGHELEIFLVRILFCLFAEDTGIFSRHQFVSYLLQRTSEDGADTDMHLGKLFQVFDTPESQRNKHLSEELNAFPYVNGHLFRERLDLPSFSAAMRDLLIDCAWFDWGSISPAIFGSLFQGVMDKKERRALGAHYTSETNILRLIGPLFLDALQADFKRIKNLRRGKQKQLIDFQQRLSKLCFFDPACGCGNFLIVTYREIRRLELQVLREQHGDSVESHLDLGIEPLISLVHFHGIEIDEWPARIAEVAMWLTQHQMNREFARQFGREPDLLPLKTAAHIVQSNALALDWESVVSAKRVDYVLGNPPFVGKNFRTTEQSQDMAEVFSGVKNYKSLDYVTCWFFKATQFIQNSPVQVAFVSSNSITQGEQVAPLWQTLLDRGIQINFAHRTFAWLSEARGKAAVHVVIVGFSVAENKSAKRLFDYPDIKGEPEEVVTGNINPYLVDAPDVIISNRSKPLCDVSPMVYGNKPVDGGNLFLSPEEKKVLLDKQPQAEKWIKPVLGAQEFINGKERWCLWLVGISPKELRAMPEILKRVEAVKQMRLNSIDAGARKLADRPTEFRDTRLPETYILVPSVSSERREYVPMGFFDSNTVSTNLNLMIPNAGLYEFGILESKLHMTWMRTVAGRLKSDYRYSAKLVYNNYPWPDSETCAGNWKKAKQTVESAAETVLKVRAKYQGGVDDESLLDSVDRYISLAGRFVSGEGNTLADLYDPLTMPADLRKAHQKLDAAVERCYRKEKFKTDAERLSFLFARYQVLSKTERHI
ncbi:DNA methyltransferase [Candidatus Venteria ishoeyi]|uniref:site-specific DNA-methyltransferase (adenine-specific) n=1 Tax=Candidatus Venteria ishoeyi TaxID=1899563 RepID=A0A1H6FDI5_9GAMM|nr:DNA methyltransferase [Candidatus Venteria ishoeyi]SEH07461.1 N-6 DNA Methylase [Candidatus Venteria ishoeyi]